VDRHRIYLDTSVLSHLYADDAPEQMDSTWRLWEKCVAGDYKVFVSPVVFSELSDAPEPKRNQIFEAMKSVAIETLLASDAVERLAKNYIEDNVLSQKHYNDCLHLAYATIYECDALVSWNFKHLVRTSTNKGVRVVNSTNQYKEIGIVSPDKLLEG